MIAAAGVPQAVQRFLLDLPDSLARQPKAHADLVQGHGLFSVQAKVEAENFGFAPDEPAQGRVDLPAQTAAHHLIFRGFLALIRQHVEQVVVLFAEKGRVERPHRASAQ